MKFKHPLFEFHSVTQKVFACFYPAVACFYCVPVNILKRRFHRSLINLFGLYNPLVNRWRVFDNCLSPPAQIAADT